MDSDQWTQDFGVAKSMAEISPPSACTRPVMERKIRPQKDQALNCPRCHSTNTKFCYYNNYSLTQPRYFCKTCRRYWTEGGTLRNVPVGGGSRKNKKSSATSLSMLTAPAVSSQRLPDLNPPTISQFSNQNPKIHDQGQHLNLGFQGPHDYHHGIPQFLELPKIENRDVMSSSSNSASSSSSSTPLSALNFLRNNGINAARGFNSFIPMAPSGLESTNALFANFPFQECKPNLSFSIDGNRFENPNVPQENHVNNGSLMFSLGAATKRDSSTNEGDQGKGQENSNGFWNGMLGGGSW